MPVALTTSGDVNPALSSISILNPFPLPEQLYPHALEQPDPEVSLNAQFTFTYLVCMVVPPSGCVTDEILGVLWGACDTHPAMSCVAPQATPLVQVDRQHVPLHVHV
jgi:hypothetical protein